MVFFHMKLRNTFHLDHVPQCTVVNKGVIIEILDFELGAFSENLRHIMTWRKGIFGLSLQKKKF